MRMWGLSNMEIFIFGIIVFGILFYRNTINSKKFVDDNKDLFNIFKEEDYEFLLLAKYGDKVYDAQQVYMRRWFKAGLVFILLLLVLLNSLNSQFDTKKETALKIYEYLKSMDSTIEFEASTSSRTSMSVPKVTGGSFVERTFTYNRYNIKYYLYVPDVQDTTGLSVNMYLNGTGEMGNVLKRGLPKQLANKVVTPSSLVICTETRNEQLYYDDGYRDALVELTKEVVKEFNTDPNKVSLSGHSSGAILAYNLVKRYPGYFSAIVPISGGEYLKPEDTSLFSGVNVWAFHGDRDPHTMRANYNNVINKTIKPLKENGVDVQLTTLEGEGHNIQDEIFTKDYKDEYGNIINPLEWAFQQTRRA